MVYFCLVMHIFIIYQYLLSLLFIHVITKHDINLKDVLSLNYVLAMFMFLKLTLIGSLYR